MQMLVPEGKTAHATRSSMMDRQKDETREPDPGNDEARRHESEENRRALDDVPEPGTDPLHEGP